MTRFSVRPAALLALMVSGVVTTVRPSAAQSTGAAAAEALFNDAIDLSAHGRLPEACLKFAESQRLDPGIGTLLYLADCHEKAGHLASAWASFREAADAARAQGQRDREKTATERAATLEPRLSRLILTLAPGVTVPGLILRRDGLEFSAALLGTAIPIDAGSHTVEATAPGRRPWSVKVELREGSRESVVVPALDEFPPPVAPVATPATSVSAHSPGISIYPPPVTSIMAPPSSRLPWALAAGGVGLLGLGVGSYFGLHARSTWSDAGPHCDDARSRCDPQGAALSRQARTSGNVATALFVVGAVGVGAGVALWLWPTSSSTTVGLSPGSLLLKHSW